MISPYEMIYKSALPAFRAMVANRLMQQFDFTQQEVAKRMGVTQASISNYTRKARGVMLNLEADPNLSKAADDVSRVLAAEEPDQRQAMNLMTQVCDYIRYNQLLCSLHGDLEHGFPTEGCSACMGALPSSAATIRLKIVN